VACHTAWRDRDLNRISALILVKPQTVCAVLKNHCAKSGMILLNVPFIHVHFHVRVLNERAVESRRKPQTHAAQKSLPLLIRSADQWASVIGSRLSFHRRPPCESWSACWEEVSWRQGNGDHNFFRVFPLTRFPDAWLGRVCLASSAKSSA
jgi:hypothetical protein